jgi:MarR family transcriptional regulator, organic hydroperoxide resistance regulator
MKSNFIDSVFSIGTKCLLKKKKISLQADISQQDFMFIDMLSTDTKLSCKEFADTIGLSVSRTSRIINHLCKKGYLIRKINPDNRRAIQVSLSKKGKKIKNDIDKLKLECEKDIINSIRNDKLKIAKQGIDILQKSLE